MIENLINSFFNIIESYLAKSSKRSRQITWIFFDSIVCAYAVWISLILRKGIIPSFEQIVAPTLVAIILMVPIFIAVKVYSMVVRAFAIDEIKTLALASFLYAVAYFPSVVVIGDSPKTLGVIQPLVLFFLVSLGRIVAKFLIFESRRERNFSVFGSFCSVAIYGAGVAGRQLAMRLSSSPTTKVVALVDDDRTLAGRSVSGIMIIRPSDLRKLVKLGKVSRIYFAIPSLERSRRLEILKQLTLLDISVKTLPSLVELPDHGISAADLRDLDIDEVLGRSSILPNRKIMRGKIEGRCLFISGAGGSIGSELCRQVVRLQPRRIVLYESSEFALFQISSDLDKILSKQLDKQCLPHVVSVLGSISDEDRLSSVFATFKPETVFHAAAYKHVPLVETNALIAVQNNVIGTLNLAKVSLEHDARNFVLVSTDKAVRPTNMMGATKRVAEMILQAFNKEFANRTCFSIVRFGNVLNSSGSVIPIFQDQIKKGGPITVTHPEVTRYFMTIPEAAELVIQSVGLAEGGDVFVLDMGEPIKIVDLARRLIRLSGVTEKQAQSSRGDIEIRYIGLRPGEKLYEELLIGDVAESTAHPKITRARENFLDWSYLNDQLRVIEESIQVSDLEQLLKALQAIDNSYVPGPDVSDVVIPPKK